MCKKPSTWLYCYISSSVFFFLAEKDIREWIQEAHVLLSALYIIFCGVDTCFGKEGTLSMYPWLVAAEGRFWAADGFQWLVGVGAGIGQ